MAATDYSIRIRTSRLFGGDPFTEKHAGEVFLDGTSGRANLTVTLFGANQGSTTLVQIQQWTAQQLPIVLLVFGQQTPMTEYVIDIQGQGDFLLKSVMLTYKKVRLTITDSVGYPSDSLISGGRAAAIKLDWFIQHPGPVMTPLYNPAIPSFLSFVKVSPFGESILADKWVSNYPSLIYSAPFNPATLQPSSAFVKTTPFTENITMNKWFSATSMPIFPTSGVLQPTYFSPTKFV